MKKRKFSLSFRKSGKKTAKYTPQRFSNQTTWHNEKAYVVALLLIIGMLAIPIYTGFAVKQKSAEIIYNDNSPPPMLSDFCRDTDGSDYGTKGTINARSQESIYSFDDSCSGSILNEYYCNGNRMASELKKCPNGCSDGKCLG